MVHPGPSDPELFAFHASFVFARPVQQPRPDRPP